ncbi:MAG: hypothetical protein LWX11_10400, partial [Firmicutes bacterium]|nr:hypothetical protein [Bacillota bacterium]
MAHTSSLNFLKPALVTSVALLLSLGCAMQRANKAFDQGRFDEAVQEYQGILKNSPNHVKAKMGYRRAAARAAEVHLEKAREAEKRGQSDVVYLEVRRAAVLDPSNAVATDWIANLELAAQRKKVQEEAEDNLEIQRAKADAQPAVPLNPRSLEGMNLNYSRRTALRDIFAALSLNSGVNIILHSTFPQDAAAAVDLRGLTFQRILDTLMIQNDLFYRVIDSNTILVLKDGQQQRDKF